MHITTWTDNINSIDILLKNNIIGLGNQVSDNIYHCSQNSHLA